MPGKKYSKKIFWSDEDDCYVVIFPDFPNLSAFGNTKEEAIRDANVVLLMALESLEEDGFRPPVPGREGFPPQRTDVEPAHSYR